MTDNLVERLAAQDSIRRLLSLYCDAVSRKDADAIGDLYAQDATVIIAGGPERNGRVEIVEGLRNTATGFDFLHQKCDTGMIDVDGASARARIGVLELNRPVGADCLNLIFGAYEDHYSKQGQRWYFQRREFTLQYIVSLPADAVTKFTDFVPAFPMAP